MQYDVFIYAQNRTPAPQNVEIWLYKDLTAYYQNKYPEANVKLLWFAIWWRICDSKIFLRVMELNKHFDYTDNYSEIVHTTRW